MNQRPNAAQQALEMQYALSNPFGDASDADPEREQHRRSSSHSDSLDTFESITNRRSDAKETDAETSQIATIIGSVVGALVALILLVLLGKYIYKTYLTDNAAATAPSTAPAQPNMEQKQ